MLLYLGRHKGRLFIHRADRDGLHLVEVALADLSISPQSLGLLSAHSRRTGLVQQHGHFQLFIGHAQLLFIGTTI
jgi:hypothetical protein